MQFRDKNLGKYLNIYRNLQKELVISTVLLSCIYIYRYEMCILCKYCWAVTSKVNKE